MVLQLWSYERLALKESNEGRQKDKKGKRKVRIIHTKFYTISWLAKCNKM